MFRSKEGLLHAVQQVFISLDELNSPLVACELGVEHIKLPMVFLDAVGGSIHNVVASKVARNDSVAACSIRTQSARC